MNKLFKYYLVIWAILLVIFNVACFASPLETEGAFWVGYIFISLAFLGQLAVSYFAFDTTNQQKFFYRIPLLRISWAGLILTMIFGTIFMAVPDLPIWFGIVVCLIVLGFNVISLMKATIAAEVVEKIDAKIKAQTFFIKSLTVDADTLLATAKSDAVKAECKKVYEAIRYSDPMSNEMLASVEGQITVKFATLTGAVKADDAIAVSVAAEDLLILIKDRNNKCKLLK